MISAGLMTVDDFCKKHSLSRATAYRAVSAGALKLTKVGTASRIAPAHEQAWLASLPVVSGIAA